MDTPGLKISFVIVTRNRASVLGGCLESIEAQSYGPRETVVVDDASSDGTSELVRSRFPSVRLIRSDKPLGIGRARDVGLEAADGSILVFLDDDANFTQTDAAARIEAKFTAIPELGALSLRVEAPDGSVRHREIPRRDKKVPRVEMDLAYFMETGAALRSEALKRVGAFDPDFVYAADGLDLSFRLFAAGYRIVFEPEVTVVHHAVPSRDNTDLRDYYYMRHHIWIAARYLPFPYAQTHALFWVLGPTLMSVRSGHPIKTLRGAVAGFSRWHELRHSGAGLSRSQVREMSRLSGRTWY